MSELKNFNINYSPLKPIGATGIITSSGEILPKSLSPSGYNYKFNPTLYPESKPLSIDEFLSLEVKKASPQTKGFTWAQGLTAGLQGLTTGMQNYNAVNSDMVNNNINQASGLQVGAVSTSDLLNQYNNQQLLDENVTMKDVGWDWKEQLGNVASATLSGAATGNWLGAAIGGGAALAGSTIGGFKAKREAEEASKRAKATNVLTNQKYVNAASDLYDQSFNSLLKNYAAYGGNLFNNGGNMMDFTIINNGGTHEQNPYGGVPMGVDNEGTPNLVEEGEVIYNDYVYSNRLKPSKKYKTKYKIDDSRTYADIAKEIQKNFEENPNDPITKKGVESRMEELKQDHEMARMKKNKKTSNRFDIGGLIPQDKWMQLMPIITTGTGLISNVFTSPDYEYANKIENAPKRITPMEFSPLTSRLKLVPLDEEYMANKLRSEAAANRNAILNTAGNAGAARAGLIALDRNAQDALGSAYRQARLDNQERTYKETAFNLGVDQFNAQQLMQIGELNRRYKDAYNKERLAALQTAYAMRDAEDSARAAAISSGLSGLGTNFSNIYKDRYTNAQLDWLIENDILPNGYTKI